MKPIWPALLATNLVWAGHLVVSYYLAWMACASDDGTLEVLRHLATAVALGVTLAALWRGVRAGSTVSSAGDGAAGEEAAEHGFLARLTIALSVMLLLAIALAGAANLLLAPCR